MTPATIIALVRDAVILGALAWIILFIYHAGVNADLKADMKALQTQLAANAKTQSQWLEESRNAESQRQADMQSIAAAVGRHADSPIRLCQPTHSGPLPGAAAPSAGHPAAAGGPDERAGKDIRPAISALELKYESALAQCRAVLNSWPQ
jgi:hypothetical protein